MSTPSPLRTLVLLVNTGSPAEPTTDALKNYLAEFLGDPRVVELPKIFWWPLLYGVILPKRSPASAERYRSVWTPEGSPLVAETKATAAALQARLGEGYSVHWAMRYGTERVSDVLPRWLSQENPDRLVVLPMFAQYATQTTAAVYDAVDGVLAKSAWRGEVKKLTRYFDDPGYIEALAASVRRHWDAKGFLTGKGRLLFSFHGIPQASVDKGSRYEAECRETARLVAERLGLRDGAWCVAFQSKFGRAKWIGPATLEKAKALAREGVTRLDVMCPGFAADCLETLEEIGAELKNAYLAAGGGEFRYIPCLNAQPQAVAAYADLVRRA